MTVTDAPAPAIFGQITVEDMRRNELLIKVVLPLVREACRLSKGRFTTDEVFDGLIDGTFRMWGVMRLPSELEAIIVTKANAGVFEVLLLGPDYGDALAFLPKLQGEAVKRGCQRMRITGPKFWGREFLPGFDLVACVFEKEIELSKD